MIFGAAEATGVESRTSDGPANDGVFGRDRVGEASSRPRAAEPLGVPDPDGIPGTPGIAGPALAAMFASAHFGHFLFVSEGNIRTCSDPKQLNPLMCPT